MADSNPDQTSAPLTDETPGNDTTNNKTIVANYWAAHFARDWEAMGTFFTNDVHYDDIGAPGDGCLGPHDLVQMLRLGLEPLEAYIHHPQRMMAEGDVVMTEHIEEWRFHTGEVLRHPYVSIFELRDGLVSKWHDYSNIANITDNVPEWWLDHVSAGWQD